MRFKLPFFGKRKVGYDIRGENNKIIIVEEDGTERELGKDERIEGLEVKISHSDNNIIKIIQPCNFQGARFEFLYSKECRIIIDKSPQFMWNVKLAAGEHELFEFGEGSSTAWYGEVHILDSNAGVKIGKDCMFSGGIVFLASDGHRIIDVATNKVINDKKEYIEIGDHVWCATGSKFLKGCKVKSNSIVGANSVVTKKIDEKNVIIAGNPARICKRNVNWIR